MTKTKVNKPSARKSVCLFTNIFYVKNRTANFRVRAEKSKHRSIKSGCGLCKNKTKCKWHSKINEQIKRKLYKWITCHPQVVQSQISNYCLKVIFDDHAEPQAVPKLLLRVSVREYHNSLFSYPNDSGLEEARDE